MKRLTMMILATVFVLTNGFGVVTFASAKKKKSSSQHRPKVYSEAAVLMNMSTGRILFSKNMHEKLYPASTTKIMTAIVALKYGRLNSIVTVGRDAANAEPSKIGLKAGERIKLKYLLYALMVDSANDAAIAIADQIGGSVSGFAKMMNREAKALGCSDTHFVNPNGLPDRNHYTTAYDLAIMTKHAMGNSVFKKLVSTVHYTIPATNKTKAISITNHNKMLYHTAYYYSGCVGVKTGYTVSARHTLVSAAVRGRKKLLAVILKDNVSPYRGIINLFDYGFNH